MTSIRELIAVLDTRFSFHRVEKWDRIGLQIGDENAQVARVLVAHEVTEEVLQTADGCQALIVYHPLLFRPLENLDFKNHVARLASECLRRGLNVVAVHSALDQAPPPNALGDRLAQTLGLRDIKVLSASGREALWQIVVFVPLSALESVREAMWQSGAGRVGDYDRAGFWSEGQGTFRPLEGAHPATGEVGRDETTREVRLEMIVAERFLDAVIEAMKSAHPYEEVAHGVYPLHNRAAAFGSCRAGTLPSPLSLEDWAQRVERVLQAPNVRIVRGKRDEKNKIATVACVPGAGASFLAGVARAGIDCLVTGDIKHHDALLDCQLQAAPNQRSINVFFVELDYRIALERKDFSGWWGFGHESQFTPLQTGWYPSRSAQFPTPKYFGSTPAPSSPPPHARSAYE